MSAYSNDASFRKAQQAYDNALPPEADEVAHYEEAAA